MARRNHSIPSPESIPIDQKFQKAYQLFLLCALIWQPIVTARSELRKVLFWALSVTFLLWPSCVADADIASWRNFVRCKVHFASKSCLLLYWQRYCTALQQRTSAKLCSVVQGIELRNFRRERHLYSAGRPSRWASAHIPVCVWNISGTAEWICAKFTRKTCLLPCWDKYECQCQRSRSPGTNTAFRPFRRPTYGLCLVKHR